MKALSMTLALALTMMAATSHAFCMRQFMAQQTRDDQSTNVRQTALKDMNTNNNSSQTGVVKKRN